MSAYDLEALVSNEEFDVTRALVGSEGSVIRDGMDDASADELMEPVTLHAAEPGPGPTPLPEPAPLPEPVPLPEPSPDPPPTNPIPPTVPGSQRR